MSSKLNQIIAVASSKKSAAKSALEKAYHTFQKPDLFAGLHKVYEPKDEEGEVLPEESKRIQQKVSDILQGVEEAWTNMVDVVVTNDEGNSRARADVIVDGTTVLTNVPVTSLIFMEKQLTDLNTLVTNIPTLSEAQEWSFDNSAGLYRSTTTKTTRTKKVQKPIVLYDATPEHPAQCSLVSEDIIEGTWNTTAISSALTTQQVKQIKNRITKLKEAVVKAREEANSTEVENRKVGSHVFSYIFSDVL